MMSLATLNHSDASMMQGNKSFLFGIGVSVSVHILLLLAYRNTGPLPASAPEPPAAIVVRIAPPAPPRVEPTPAQRQEAPAPRSARSARRSAPEPVIAVPASPQQETPSDPFVVQQADAPADTPAPAPAQSATPQFDMNTARQTARQLAGQTRLGREGLANAQFPDPPLETESKFAKAISKAKRRNCKDGIPGGLLAPLFLAMDKKDSGCKW